MAENPKGSEQKTLEMRVAELEDRLSKVYVTEDEIKAYQKVASLVGGQAPAGGPPVSPFTCVVNACVIHQCIVQQCTIIQQCIRQCTIIQQCIRQCTIIQQCNECGGGCAPGGGVVGGGGFGGLGG
jgi:hypothetical protein